MSKFGEKLKSLFCEGTGMKTIAVLLGCVVAIFICIIIALATKDGTHHRNSLWAAFALTLIGMAMPVMAVLGIMGKNKLTKKFNAYKARWGTLNLDQLRADLKQFEDALTRSPLDASDEEMGKGNFGEIFKIGEIRAAIADLKIRIAAKEKQAEEEQAGQPTGEESAYY